MTRQISFESLHNIYKLLQISNHSIIRQGLFESLNRRQKKKCTSLNFHLIWMNRFTFVNPNKKLKNKKRSGKSHSSFYYSPKRFVRSSSNVLISFHISLSIVAKFASSDSAYTASSISSLKRPL